MEEVNAKARALRADLLHIVRDEANPASYRASLLLAEIDAFLNFTPRPVPDTPTRPDNPGEGQGE